MAALQPIQQCLDSEIKKILIDAVIEIYERKKAESGETLTFYPSSETLTDVMGKVIANFIMTDDYRIEITFSMEKSKKYICKLTAKAIVNRRTSRYEEEKDGKLVEVKREDIHVYWNECTIDKG